MGLDILDLYVLKTRKLCYMRGGNETLQEEVAGSIQWQAYDREGIEPNWR